MARHPELIAQDDLEAEMRRLSGLLDQATSKIAYRETRAAQAKVEYEIAYAKRLLQVEAKTVDERKAIATVDTADEYMRFRVAEAVARAASEAARNFRAQLSAVQTVSANQRYMIDRGIG